MRENGGESEPRAITFAPRDSPCHKSGKQHATKNQHVRDIAGHMLTSVAPLSLNGQSRAEGVGLSDNTLFLSKVAIPRWMTGAMEP